MPINPRGSWNLAEAVKSLWNDAGLEDSFRAGWGNQQNTTQFFALNDTQARPAHGVTRHPVPYAIYEQSPAIRIGGSSGGSANPLAGRQQYEQVDYQFTVYAASKADAKAAALLIAAAFDSPQFTMTDDGQIVVFRTGDFATMRNDRTWSWTLMYRAKLDCTYPA